jgi:hypothetical protein
MARGIVVDASELARRIIAGDRAAASLVVDALGLVGKHFGRESGWLVVRGLHDGELNPAGLLWAGAIERMIQAVNERIKRAAAYQSDPWFRKCDTWVKCIKLRAADRYGIKQRTALWRYSTGTWRAAVERMIQNANKNVWHGRRDPWKRWAMTASKNTNRRWEGRYAERKARDDQSRGTGVAA